MASSAAATAPGSQRGGLSPQREGLQDNVHDGRVAGSFTLAGKGKGEGKGKGKGGGKGTCQQIKSHFFFGWAG